MRERTIAELIALTGASPDTSGTGTDPTTVVGPEVVIDSRLAGPGALFVALPGEHVDGQDFIAAAASSGAAAALCLRPSGAPIAHLIVPDAQRALSDLARGVVGQEVARGLVCVAITGSSGKTSTKDLVGQLLAADGPTISPVGSFNNEIGVPLTALRIAADTRYLVSEMGARGVGHIAWLCSIVPPRVGVVLNVGRAHVGEFGSVEGIAQAKGEIIEGLPDDGWAVLNADDANVLAMTSRTGARIALFSVVGEPSGGDLNVWAEDDRADGDQRHSFTLRATGAAHGSAPVTLRVSGIHQVANAVAAAAVGLAVGMSLAAIAAALSVAEARSSWRMQLMPRPDGVLIVNDSYNANPDSMRAALTSTAAMRRSGGRLVAVLGDMLELGDTATAEHYEVGALAAELGFELIAVGGFADGLVAGAQSHGGAARSVPDREAAAAAAESGLAADDVVLVKASRGLALDFVAQRLLDGARRNQ